MANKYCYEIFVNFVLKNNIKCICERILTKRRVSIVREIRSSTFNLGTLKLEIISNGNVLYMLSLVDSLA